MSYQLLSIWIKLYWKMPWKLKINCFKISIVDYCGRSNDTVCIQTSLEYCL